MLPRQVRRVANDGTQDEGSASAPVRARGRGRGRGRRGRTEVVLPERQQAGEAAGESVEVRIGHLEGLMEQLIREIRVQQAPPVGPVEHVVQPVPPLVRVPVSLVDFMRVNPLIFSGDDVQEDPQDFMDAVDQYCRALNCSDDERVRYIPLQFRGLAATWWRMIEHQQLLERGVVTWPQL